MRKLRLIIPFLKYPSFFRGVFLISIGLALSFKVEAFEGYGCHVVLPNVDWVFYTPDMVIGRANPPHTWISITTGNGGYYIQTSTRCIDDYSTPCTVYKFGSTGTAPADILYTGYYSRIYDNCPFDDYIPVLAISLGLLVIYNRKTWLIPKL